MKKWILFLIFFSALLMTCGCSVPKYVWPQNDINFQEIHKPTLEKKILIASRKSEFKIAVVQKIEEAFKNRNVYIKIIGIENLKYEDANQYSAVVLINTAMGWEIDRKAQNFLNRFRDVDSIIVLTTSDGGDISPDTEKYHIDAISSASTLDDSRIIADKIISKINDLIQK